MALTSPGAQEVVSRLMALASAPSGANGDLVAADRMSATERVFRVVADSLSRGFGPYGYHALLTRALAKARQAHPSLAEIRVRSPLEPYLEGLNDAAQAHGVEAATEGAFALLATIVDLLGRLIGEDLAVRLVAEAHPALAPDSEAGREPKRTPEAGSPGYTGHET